MAKTKTYGDRWGGIAITEPNSASSPSSPYWTGDSADEDLEVF